MPVAFWKFACQFSGDERKLRRVGPEPKQRAAQSAFRRRNQQDGTRFCFKACLLRPVESDGIDGTLVDVGGRNGENGKCFPWFRTEGSGALDELIRDHCLLS